MVLDRADAPGGDRRAHRGAHRQARDAFAPSWRVAGLVLRLGPSEHPMVDRCRGIRPDRVAPPLAGRRRGASRALYRQLSGRRMAAVRARAVRGRGAHRRSAFRESGRSKLYADGARRWCASLSVLSDSLGAAATGRSHAARRRALTQMAGPVDGAGGEWAISRAVRITSPGWRFTKPPAL